MSSPNAQENDSEEVINAEESINHIMTNEMTNHPPNNNANSSPSNSAENNNSSGSNRHVNEEVSDCGLHQLSSSTTITPPSSPAVLATIEDDSGPPLPITMMDAIMIDDAITDGSGDKQQLGSRGQGGVATSPRADGPDLPTDDNGPTLPPSMVHEPIEKSDVNTHEKIKPELDEDNIGPALPPSMTEGSCEKSHIPQEGKASDNDGQELENITGANTEQHNSYEDSNIVIPSREQLNMQVENHVHNATAGTELNPIVVDEESPPTSGDSNPNNQGGRDENESLPIIPEAFLVVDSPSNDDNTPPPVMVIAHPLLPWHKQPWAKRLFALVFVIVATLAIALGISLSSNKSKNNDDSVANDNIDAVIPPPLPILQTNAPSFSFGPTDGPTTNVPSGGPTDVPSVSTGPSFSPTACELVVSSNMQRLDYLLGDVILSNDDDNDDDDGESGTRTPKVAIDGRNAVVVTSDWQIGTGYVTFYSLDGFWQWKRANTFFEEDHEYYSVSLSGSTAFVGFPYARSYAGSVHIYERTSAGVWTKEDHQTLTFGGEGTFYSRFGWYLDVDGDLACVGDDRGDTHVYRRDDGGGGWGQFGDLIDDVELAHQCSIVGDTIAIRNWEGVALYKYDVDLRGFALLQDTIVTVADSSSLGQDHLAFSSNSSMVVYHREEKNDTFNLLQSIVSPDFREDVKYVGDNDDFLMSDDFYFNKEWLSHGDRVALDKDIMVVGGYNYTHIFSYHNDNWEEILTLQSSYDDYQLSGRNLLVVTQDDEIFYYSLEDCVPTPTQTPSGSIAPTVLRDGDFS